MDELQALSFKKPGVAIRLHGIYSRLGDAEHIHQPSEWACLNQDLKKKAKSRKLNVEFTICQLDELKLAIKWAKAKPSVRQLVICSCPRQIAGDKHVREKVRAMCARDECVTPFFYHGNTDNSETWSSMWSHGAFTISGAEALLSLQPPEESQRGLSKAVQAVPNYVCVYGEEVMRSGAHAWNVTVNESAYVLVGVCADSSASSRSFKGSDNGQRTYKRNFKGRQVTKTPSKEGYWLFGLYYGEKHINGEEIERYGESSSAVSTGHQNVVYTDVLTTMVTLVYTDAGSDDGSKEVKQKGKQKGKKKVGGGEGGGRETARKGGKQSQPGGGQLRGSLEFFRGGVSMGVAADDLPPGLRICCCIGNAAPGVLVELQQCNLPPSLAAPRAEAAQAYLLDEVLGDPDTRSAVVALIDGRVSGLEGGDKDLLVGNLVTQLESMDLQERREELEQMSGKSAGEWKAALAELRAIEKTLGWTAHSSSVSVREEGRLATKTVGEEYSIVLCGEVLRSGVSYREVVVRGDSRGLYVGLARPGLDTADGKSYAKSFCRDVWLMLAHDGGLYGNGKGRSDPAGPFVEGDVLGVLVNLDDGSLGFFKNGEKHGPGYSAGSVAGPVVLAMQTYYIGQGGRMVEKAAWPVGYEVRNEIPSVAPTAEEEALGRSFADTDSMSARCFQNTLQDWGESGGNSTSTSTDIRDSPCVTATGALRPAFERELRGLLSNGWNELQMKVLAQGADEAVDSTVYTGAPGIAYVFTKLALQLPAAERALAGGMGEHWLGSADRLLQEANLHIISRGQPWAAGEKSTSETQPASSIMMGQTGLFVVEAINAVAKSDQEALVRAVRGIEAAAGNRPYSCYTLHKTHHTPYLKTLCSSYPVRLCVHHQRSRCKLMNGCWEGLATYMRVSW
jgi:hypothetical protein